MEISEAVGTLCEMVLDMRMRGKELHHAIRTLPCQDVHHLECMTFKFRGDLRVFNVKTPSLTII